MSAGTPGTPRARYLLVALRGCASPLLCTWRQRTMLAQHAARAPARRGVAAPHHAHAPARLLAHPLASSARSRRASLAPAVARHVVAAAALTEQELAKRALRLDTFEAQAVDEALVRLRAALGADADACDAATLVWLLRDRKLDVEKTVAKVRSYLEWRAGGFAKLTAADVAAEAATGKARLLAQRDLLGRPTVLVKVALNRTDTRVLVETERLCVFLMDEALSQMHAEGRSQTVLTVFDLRGFSTANADIPFIRFFIKLMFDIYPKRIGQVLLVGAPLVFQPVWQIIKPLLGKYAALVQFVSPAEAEQYFGSPAGGVLG